RPPTVEELATAPKLFARTLEAPEGLVVRTIHSFAESLLGRFPIEAEVAPHFAVIDERRAAEMRSEAQGRILAAAASGETAIGDAMAHLAGLVGAEDFQKLMADLDKQRGRLRRVLAAAGGRDGLLARLRRTQGIAAGDTRATVIAAAACDGAFDEAELWRAAKALDKGSTGDRERAEAIRRWLKLDATRRAETFIDGYATIFVTRKWEPVAEKTLVTKKAKEADPEAAGILLDERVRVAAAMAKLKSVAIAEATAALLTGGEAMVAAYEEIKRACALRDYDDLIADAGRLLATDDGVSWVHYKLDGGIDHVLVDEAQDTSPDQWRVVERLAGDFFSGRGARDDDRPSPRTVFAVGDEKQSIFSFQGADPAVFGRLRDHFRKRLVGIGGRLQEVELERSHRSASAVLKVVDKVFENPAARDGLSFDARPILHHTERAGQAGLVELWPTLKPDDEPETRPWDWPFDKPSPESPRVRLADQIADTIKGWLDRGEILESAVRPIEPGDIMILVRSRGTFADQMVKALERRGVPVAGRDRLKLLDHIAVMDLVAAGRFALLPDDDLNTATVLKGPFCGFDDDDLFDLAHGRSGRLWEALKARVGERRLFAAAEATLATWLKRADLTPPFEFYSRLLGPDGGRKCLIARLGAEVAEPVEGFLAQALDFERDHEPSLQAFLHWLELGNTEIKREMERGRDEVRVLTVHGAKGLEAGIVFLPDTCSLPDARLDPHIHWRHGGEDNDAFVLWRPAKGDEDTLARSLHNEARADIEREYRRLLYVAMTRARDRLYICGFENKRGRDDGCWYDLIEPAVRALGAETTLASSETVVRVADAQTALPDGMVAPTVKTGVEAPPAWALADPTPEPEPAKPLTPSRPIEDEPAVSSPLGRDDGALFKRGLIVHRLLQSLPNLAPDRREAAARAFVARPALAIDSNAQNEIVAETLAVLVHPDFAHLFRPGSLAEVPIAGLVGDGDGARAISGQVDRLVVTDETVIVVDFKTNRPPPEKEDDVAPAYLRQMAAYRWAIPAADGGLSLGARENLSGTGRRGGAVVDGRAAANAPECADSRRLFALKGAP
ncbi:MAG: double-strand break repair helicase AddA, partial [Rhodospirillales bacterium]|nr:double-strand break repair helicase AddA [Rhodospirillales bacterium]